MGGRPIKQSLVAFRVGEVRRLASHAMRSQKRIGPAKDEADEQTEAMLMLVVGETIALDSNGRDDAGGKAEAPAFAIGFDPDRCDDLVEMVERREAAAGRSDSVSWVRVSDIGMLIPDALDTEVLPLGLRHNGKTVTHVVLLPATQRKGLTELGVEDATQSRKGRALELLGL